MVEISQSVFDNDVHVLAITGEIDAHNAQNLTKILIDLLNLGHHRIVVDLSKLEFISSSGLRAMVLAYQEAVQLGGKIRLAGPNDQARRTFEISGLFDMFTIKDKLQECLTDW